MRKWNGDALGPAIQNPVQQIGNYGSYEGRCVICGGAGVSDAYYCRECCQEERVRAYVRFITW